MPRPYESLISVSDEYLEAAGQALFNFAYAEGNIAYLVDRLVPGYLNLTRGRAADGIANDLKLASGVTPDADTVALADRFLKLSSQRDALLLAIPITAASNDQILSTLHFQSEPWTEKDLWDFAETAQEIAIIAHNLYARKAGL